MLSFEIIILGSGTIVPSLQRSACSVLIRIDRTQLVLDTGPGTIHRLLKCGTSIFEVSHICYSHFHPDHISELVPLLFATKYPNAALQQHPVVITGGQGFMKFYNGLRAVFGDWMAPEDQWIKLIEIPPDFKGYTFSCFQLQTAPMQHHPESLAYRIQLADGRSLVYSGDTDFCEELITLAEGADLFICECSTPNEMKIANHLTPFLAGSIAAKAGVKKLVLTHLYPECENVDLVDQAKQSYSGPIVVAEDLMRFNIS